MPFRLALSADLLFVEIRLPVICCIVSINRPCFVFRKQNVRVDRCAVHWCRGHMNAKMHLFQVDLAGCLWVH